MRTSGNDHADPVITSDDAAIANDGHDSTLDCRRPCVPVLCDRPSKLFSKPLDFRARGAQTGNFDNGISNPQQRALRQGRQINPPRCDVLAQVAWPHVNSSPQRFAMPRPARAADVQSYFRLDRGIRLSGQGHGLPAVSIGGAPDRSR